MNPIPFSASESNRFNLNIFRGQIDVIDIAALKNLIATNKVDILILRIPSKTEASHYKLNSIGYNCIHADSLVTYTVALQDHIIPEISKEIRFEVITKENHDMLGKMIPVIFKDYQNHYFSNPVLEKKKITEGYLEWAHSHTNNTLNNISWYILKNNTIAGFANCTFNVDKKECQIVLNGVMPGYEGQKIYTYLVRNMQLHFRSAGFTKMSISSQLQNYPVQKVWVREGFFLTESHETYHINSFLSNPSANRVQGS